MSQFHSPPLWFVPNRVRKGPLAQLVEQLTLNQEVGGSSPLRPTRKIKGLERFSLTPSFFL